jgi:hypothetical protein
MGWKLAPDLRISLLERKWVGQTAVPHLVENSIPLDAFIFHE